MENPEYNIEENEEKKYFKEQSQITSRIDQLKNMLKNFVDAKIKNSFFHSFKGDEKLHILLEKCKTSVLFDNFAYISENKKKTSLTEDIIINKIIEYIEKSKISNELKTSDTSNVNDMQNILLLYRETVSDNLLTKFPELLEAYFSLNKNDGKISKDIKDKTEELHKLYTIEIESVIKKGGNINDDYPTNLLNDFKLLIK